MKKLIFAIIIILTWIPSSSAETYFSPFGFSINIPSQWQIVSKEEMKKNSYLLDFESEVYKNVDKTLMEKIKENVPSGEMEYYFNKNTSDTSFNICVIEEPLALPKNSSKERICKELPAALSQNFGKPITVYECEFKKVADSDSLYLVFNGLKDGTIYIQYHIPKSPSICITMGTTCEKENYAIVRKEFDEIISSFKITKYLYRTPLIPKE